MAPPPGPSSKRRDSTDTPAAQPYSKTVAKEIRRSRGEIACAECRRLKVRCNRQIPCSTCISRGCAALCPNGLLPPGDNSRFVSAAKGHLEKQISRLQERMRALEDALAIAQANEDDEPHPLLKEPLRFDDEGEAFEVPEEAEEKDGEQQALPVEAITDSFGTLHIDQRGKTLRFYGPTGGAESLLDDEQLTDQPLDPDDNNINLRALGLPAELDPFYFSFPLGPTGIPTTPIRAIIESYLPPWDRAVQLCSIMLENLSWMFQVVTFQQFTQDLMPSIYTTDSPEARPGTPTCGPHDLAMFFGVLTLGALIDLSLPPYNGQAQLYYVLCRCALTLESPLARASLSTVKTFHLISLYNGMSGKESNMSNTYTVLNFAGRLATKIGLHIDPAHWNMSAKEAYNRRTFFWNLALGDVWQSLGTGRPSGLTNAFGFCRIPTEEEEREYQLGEKNTFGFGVWNYHISEELLIPVMRLVMSVKPPSYRDVWELDKKIRSYKFPEQTDSSMESPSVSVAMGSFVRSNYRELILLSLHRPFFAQALAMNPENPLNTPYGRSFITAYHCAWRVIQTTSLVFQRHHQLMSRVWMVWSLNFGSAIIIGAVASRCKDLPIEPPPLAVLHQVCSLFEAASKTNSRAAKALPVLLKMRERAVRMHGTAGNAAGGEELAILTGKPRLTVAAPTHSLPVAGPSRTHASVHSPARGWEYSAPAPEPRYAGASYAPPPAEYQRSEYQQAVRSQFETYQSHQPVYVAGQHLDPYAAAIPQDLWETQYYQGEAHAYETQAVDFNLGDAWMTFMRSIHT